MKALREVWIVDDDHSIRWVLERALLQADISTRSFENGQQVLSQLLISQPEAVVSDIRMPGINGLDLLGQIREQAPALPVIIMTAHSDLDSAVSSYQGGAFDYLPKPFDIDEAVHLVKRAVAHAREQRERNQEQEGAPRQTAAIIGEAPAMQEVFRAIGRLSHSHITVLINGESGTGKELVARALHQHSPRANASFLALNMAAIPRELIESELFGHEKGAFTGAAGQRAGRFEQANGGTLFLDEIGDMPHETQTRLLRVLAEGEFYRVGGTSPVRTDVRIIAATHQDLEALVSAGNFREDLFHRLNVIRIHLPRLADRREDIPELTRHFLGRAAEELSVPAKVLSKDAERWLTALDWPGNVRQLENTCRWLTVMAAGREIHVADLPPEFLGAKRTCESGGDWRAGLARWAREQLQTGHASLLDVALPEFERILIHAALAHTHGRKREAAELLGWGRNTLTRKLKELGIGTDADDDGPSPGDP